jgi:hypothetical protein
LSFVFAARLEFSPGRHRLNEGRISEVAMISQNNILRGISFCAFDSQSSRVNFPTASDKPAKVQLNVDED